MVQKLEAAILSAEVFAAVSGIPGVFFSETPPAGCGGSGHPRVHLSVVVGTWLELARPSQGTVFWHRSRRESVALGTLALGTADGCRLPPAHLRLELTGVGCARRWN